ncbi:hypothetical protein GTO10_01770 [Candidatus Saccharibacteria bacterium]|nr:hypothetical protein [Candidatus Saccharibacteria bacterium]
MADEKVLEAVELKNERLDLTLPVIFTRINPSTDPLFPNAVKVSFNFGGLHLYTADGLPNALRDKISLRARLLVQQYLGWDFPEMGGWIEPSAVVVTRHNHQLALL